MVQDLSAAPSAPRDLSVNLFALRAYLVGLSTLQDQSVGPFTPQDLSVVSALQAAPVQGLFRPQVSSPMLVVGPALQDLAVCQLQ